MEEMRNVVRKPGGERPLSRSRRRWVPGEIFRTKRDEFAEGWRTLHNEELSNLQDSPNLFGLSKQGR
jgi:hypothetical protein